jgi:O-antigen/teichoic acid export membrane protein
VPTSVYYFYHHVPPEGRSTLIVQTTLLVAAGGLVAGATVFFGSDLIARNLSNPSLAALLPLYAVSIVFTIASEHSIAFVISQNRFKLAVLFETVEIFLRLFLLLVPLRLGYGLPGVVGGLVAFALLRWVGRNGYLFLRSGVKFSGWSKSLFVREQMGYSVPVALVSLSGMFGQTFNKGIIAASFSPAQYAVYAVGSFPIPLSTIFQASVADVLRSSLPPLVRDGNLQEVARLVREASRKLSMIVLPGFVFLFGFSEQLITLAFTNRYADSVAIFRIFILSVPLDMLILSAIPQVFGRTRLNFYINVSTVVLLVVLSYVLLHAVGFYGAVIAMVASQYYSSAAFVAVAMKLTRTTLPRLFAWGHMLRVFLSAGAAVLIARTVIGLTRSGFLDVALGGIVYCGTFLILAVWTGVLTSQDRSLVRRWLAKFLPVAAVDPRP